MEEKDPITELFTSSGPFNEEDVIKTLKPIVSIQEGTYAIYFINEKLTVDEKVLAFALAKRLLHTRGRVEQGHISAQEVYRSTGLPKGSIDGTFKRLRKDGYLVGKGQVDEIPNPKIPKVVQRLRRTEKVEE